MFEFPADLMGRGKAGLLWLAGRLRGHGEHTGPQLAALLVLLGEIVDDVGAPYALRVVAWLANVRPWRGVVVEPEAASDPAELGPRDDDPAFAPQPPAGLCCKACRKVPKVRRNGAGWELTEPDWTGAFQESGPLGSSPIDVYCPRCWPAVRQATHYHCIRCGECGDWTQRSSSEGGLMGPPGGWLPRRNPQGDVQGWACESCMVTFHASDREWDAVAGGNASRQHEWTHERYHDKPPAHDPGPPTNVHCFWCSRETPAADRGPDGLRPLPEGWGAATILQEMRIACPACVSVLRSYEPLGHSHAAGHRGSPMFRLQALSCDCCGRVATAPDPLVVYLRSALQLNTVPRGWIGLTESAPGGAEAWRLFCSIDCAKLGRPRAH